MKKFAQFAFACVGAFAFTNAALVTSASAQATSMSSKGTAIPHAQDSHAGQTRSVAAYPTSFPIGTGPQPNDSTNNPDMKTLIVTATCFATNYTKTIEGMVGQNSPLTMQQIVATENGVNRISITFVVPYNWYYEVRYDHNPNNDPGLGPQETCTANGWWIN